MPEPKQLVDEGFWEYRTPPLPMGCFKCANDIFNIERLEDQQPHTDPAYLRIKCAVCGELVGHLTTNNVTWGDVAREREDDGE